MVSNEPPKESWIKTGLKELFKPVPTFFTILAFYATPFAALSEFNKDPAHGWHSHKNAIAWTVLAIASGVVAILTGPVWTVITWYRNRSKCGDPNRV